MRFNSVAVVLFYCAIAPSVSAQEDVDSQPPEEAIVSFQKQASEYEFKDTSTGERLTMHPQPLMHWGNPARNGEDGAVFVWKSGEQPAVIGTCFTYRYRDQVNRKHAFQILADVPVQGRHRNRVIWSPQPNSLVHLPLPSVPPPAGTPSARNAQLRNLARRFQVELTKKDGRLEQCRLVPQPLYRFEGGETRQVSGAIFSFAIGTDPEALLILDQRADESGKPKWHYAFARFTFYALEGSLDRESVWKVEVSESLTKSILTRPDYQREPYITFKPDWLD